VFLFAARTYLFAGCFNSIFLIGFLGYGASSRSLFAGMDKKKCLWVFWFCLFLFFFVFCLFCGFFVFYAGVKSFSVASSGSMPFGIEPMMRLMSGMGSSVVSSRSA